MTRSICASVVFVAGLINVCAQDHVIFQDVEAENLFRYSRAAISGGGGSINHLRSLVLKGTSRVAGNDAGLVNAAVEIKMLLPDHYMRTDTAGAWQRVGGFSSKTLLNAIREDGQVSTPPERFRQALLTNERNIAARMLLGALTYVGADVNLRFASIPLAVEIVDPRVSARTTIAVTNSQIEKFTATAVGEHFSVRFVVDATTRAPAQITWVGPDKGTVVMTFDDRRLVSGVKFPHHMKTGEGDRVFDELFISEVRFNAELSKTDFRK